MSTGRFDVASLEIEIPSIPRTRRSVSEAALTRGVVAEAGKPLATPDPSKPEAYVDKGSLVAFVAGVSAQNREDVLKSTLLAQLAADKKHNRENAVMEWYKFYQDVLGNIGWAVQGYIWSDYRSSKMSFTMDEAVVEIIAAAFTGQAELVIAAALDALRKLPKEDGRLQLFHNSSTAGKVANFQISACTETNGTVAMNTAAFYTTASKDITNVLFFSFSSASDSLKKATNGQTLDSTVYGKVRTQILNKLGENAASFVAKLDLDI